MRGLHQQGVDIFHWSVEQLRNSPYGNEADRQRVVGACLAAQGHCVQPLSRARAAELAHESVALLRRLPAGSEMILALKLLEECADDDDERLRLQQEALAIARGSDTGWWLPKCMMDLGYSAIARGDYDTATEHIVAARAVYRAAGNAVLDVQALLMLADIAKRQGDYTRAQQLAQECLALAEDTAYSAAVWWSHLALAEAALLQGDTVCAYAHYRAGLAVCQRLDDLGGSAYAYCGLSRAACTAGDQAEAHHFLEEAFRLAKRLGDRSVLLELVYTAAGLIAAARAERALQLVGVVLRHPASSQDTKARAAILRTRLEGTLAPERVAAALEGSEEIDLDITLGTLFSELHPPQTTPAPVEPQVVSEPLVEPLTERELEVLRAIAEGLSNYDIAMRLFVGVSTVKTHINHLYGKLGVRSRTQALVRARALRLL
jgi:ATP/maltotriose-dependent transcriptional regulator MalT